MQAVGTDRDTVEFIYISIYILYHYTYCTSIKSIHFISMYISLIYSDSEKSKRKQSNMARNSKRSAIPSHAPIADSDSPVESKNNRPRFKKQRIKFERSIGFVVRD